MSLQMGVSRTVTTLIKTIPSSMLSMAKPGSSVTTTQVGTKTIVIAAPKGSSGSLSTPTKIITSMPKLAGQAGNTQFIVVSPQSSSGATSQLASLSFSLSLWCSVGLEEKFESLSCHRVPAFFVSQTMLCFHSLQILTW